MSATRHETSWSETILRLRVGEGAPKGYEIKRLIGHFQQPVGSGTNYEDVYVVACRTSNPAAAAAASSEGTPP